MPELESNPGPFVLKAATVPEGHTDNSSIEIAILENIFMLTPVRARMFEADIILANFGYFEGREPQIAISATSETQSSSIFMNFAIRS